MSSSLDRYYCFEYTVMLGPVLNRVKNGGTLSCRQGSKICVLNRVRVSMSRPNPATQIPVEYRRWANQSKHQLSFLSSALINFLFTTPEYLHGRVPDFWVFCVQIND